MCTYNSLVLKLKTKILKVTAISLLCIVVVLSAGMLIYASDYYHADIEAVSAFADCNVIKETQLSGNLYAYIPENPQTGFIFYPGGKVDCNAYAPLMRACAQRDILCLLLEMPLNLAVLDINAADGIQAKFPEIETWYIGGHSLGGAMSAAYAGDNAADFDGIILLASYSTADLSTSGLEVLCIYGSEDGVMNRDKYAENLVNLPVDYTELVIEGGNHSGFGFYGQQKGDGTSSISAQQQITITADAISNFIGSKNDLH